METLFVNFCVLESCNNKAILHFNFSDEIKIEIHLCIEYSIVKQIFNDLFEEVDFEYRGVEKQSCFTFGKKRLPLKGVIRLSQEVSYLILKKLEYIENCLKNSNTECKKNPLKYASITQYNFYNIGKNIFELLEE